MNQDEIGKLLDRVAEGKKFASVNGKIFVNVAKEDLESLVSLADGYGQDTPQVDEEKSEVMPFQGEMTDVLIFGLCHLLTKFPAKDVSNFWKTTEQYIKDTNDPEDRPMIQAAAGYLRGKIDNLIDSVDKGGELKNGNI